MRTTVDLDRSLLDRAKEALGTTTYREAITVALEEAISRVEVRGLVEALQGSDAVWDLEALTSYRRLGRGDAS